MGSALEDGLDVEWPSSHIDVAAESNVPSWSCVCRHVRGRKVVELLSEAVADDGLLILITAKTSFAVQGASTFG